MVERRGSPNARRVALIARVRKISARVIRACGILVICLVAHVTIRIGDLEIIVDMA